MNRSPVVKLEADARGNSLRIRFVGHVDAAGMENGMREIENLLTKMRPGFLVLTDLSCLESMDTACAPLLSKIMDRCKEKGVGKVVRVIPRPEKDIGFNILSCFHYGHKVDIVTCETPAEAEKLMKS